MKIGQVVLEKMFNAFMGLYLSIGQGQGQIPPQPHPTLTREQNFDPN